MKEPRVYKSSPIVIIVLIVFFVFVFGGTSELRRGVVEYNHGGTYTLGVR